MIRTCINGLIISITEITADETCYCSTDLSDVHVYKQYV